MRSREDAQTSIGTSLIGFCLLVFGEADWLLPCFEGPQCKGHREKHVRVAKKIKVLVIIMMLCSMRHEQVSHVESSQGRGRKVDLVFRGDLRSSRVICCWYACMRVLCAFGRLVYVSERSARHKMQP